MITVFSKYLILQSICVTQIVWYNFVKSDTTYLTQMSMTPYEHLFVTEDIHPYNDMFQAFVKSFLIYVGTFILHNFFITYSVIILVLNRRRINIY